MRGLCGGWNESGCSHGLRTAAPTDKWFLLLQIVLYSVTPEARQQILQPLSVLRPKFRVRDWSANVTPPRPNRSFGPGCSTDLDGYSK